jgi:hypothetical protein
MPTPQHNSQRKFWRSKLNESGYGSAVSTSSGANFKQVIPKDKNLANAQPNTADNKDYATGYPRPTEQWNTNHEATFQHDIDICVEEIGRDMYDALGSDTVTQPDVTNNASVYQHLFKTMDLSVTRQLPSRTWVEQLGSAINRKFPGVCLAQLALAGASAAQRLVFSGQWQGSGKNVKPSGLTGVDITGLHYLYDSMCTVKFDDGVTITNMASAPQRVNSWRFEVINQLLAGQGLRPGAAVYQSSDPISGEVRSELLLGDQSFNCVTNFRLLSNDPFLDYLLNQTSLIFTNDIVGSPITGAGTDGSLNYKLSIKAYKAPCKAIVIGENEGLVTLELTSNVLYDLTTGKDVEITLTNTIPSYTS